MRMFPSTPSILVVLVCLLPLVGCEQVPEEGAKLSIDDGWAAVQQAHADLDAKRAQLAALPEDGEGEGEGEPTPRQTLEAELDVQSRAFSDQLVDFINGSGMVEGEPLNEIQQAAIRLKSSEDILVAEQYITSRANYNRAIEIYNGALMLDPDNEALTTALAHAESMRYMTKERFAAATEGMSEAQVTAAIGVVKPGNVNDYRPEGKGVVAWFYPKEDGGVAGVWFKESGGVLRVFQLLWDQPSKSKS